MRPNRDQIALAAYFRWERRGGEHGRHDEDWVAAERDLTFGLNYQWAVRHALGGGAPGEAAGRVGAAGRRCRFCERSAPQAPFEGRHAPSASRLAESEIFAKGECDDCRAQFEAHLAGPFEAFFGPLLRGEADLDALGPGVPVAALKALVRLGIAILPDAELDHFDDAIEWVSNPDDERDAVLLDGLGLGCHVYRTPEPVPSPFASLARRKDDDLPFPYMLFFVGTGRAVLQAHLPFCPRDEELEGADLPGPCLSLSMGQGGALRSSDVRFLPMALPLTLRRRPAFEAIGASQG